MVQYSEMCKIKKKPDKPNLPSTLSQFFSCCESALIVMQRGWLLTCEIFFFIVADFGLAKQKQENSKLASVVGTVLYSW